MQVVSKFAREPESWARVLVLLGFLFRPWVSVAGLCPRVQQLAMANRTCMFLFVQIGDFKQGTCALRYSSDAAGGAAVRWAVLFSLFGTAVAIKGTKNPSQQQTRR